MAGAVCVAEVNGVLRPNVHPGIEVTGVRAGHRMNRPSLSIVSGDDQRLLAIATLVRHIKIAVGAAAYMPVDGLALSGVIHLVCDTESDAAIRTGSACASHVVMSAV